MIRLIVSVLVLSAVIGVGSGQHVQAALLQDRPGEEVREIRVYVIERTHPDRSWKEAIASITLERRSGTGATYLLPRSPKGELPVEPRSGLLRTLIGTPYYVELTLGEGAPSGTAEKSEAARARTSAPDAEPAKAPSHSPDTNRILDQVHRGTCFARKIPRVMLSEPFTATVTVRLGGLTMTSEEFQWPREERISYDQMAAQVGRSLATLRDRCRQGASFMDLRPVVVDLIRTLAKLAPAGFEDSAGAIEQDRQWCLALARGIETACYDGSTGSIEHLCAECVPRLNDLRSLLQKSKPPQELPASQPPVVK